MIPPIALTIAGSDSGGGAGIQADLKTFSALGVYGASAITALTAQNTREVRAVHAAPADFVRCQLDAVYEDLAVGATKIGMLGEASIIRAVAAGLRAHRAGNLVLDPVMVAKSGDSLLAADAEAALLEELLPLAELITPNLPEAGVLLGRAAPTDETGMRRAAEDLLSRGARAVLLKGGHLGGERCVDLFCDGHRELRFESPRRHTANTHGTGCTLSAAIAALLARGLPLAEAVSAARDYLQAAIAAADDLQVGSGHGPVQHFHALWPVDIAAAAAPATDS